jgi:hypothetical protein
MSHDGDFVRKLTFLDKNCESSEIASDIRPPFVLTNKSLFYLLSTNLYKCDFKSGQKTKLIDNHIISKLEVSQDGLNIYFLNDMRELWYMKNKSSPIKIADNVESMCINKKGDVVYFIADYTSNKGSLYYSINGGGKIKIEDAKDVNSINSYGSNIIYYSNYSASTFDVYYSTGDANFSLLQKDIKHG